MLKVRFYSLLIIICLLFLNSGLINEAGAYTHGWVSNRGDRLDITITPNTSNFKTGNIYNFSITITSTSFAPDQDSFYNVSVQLRLLFSNGFIYSKEKGDFIIINEFDSISTTATIPIPEKEELGLGYDEGLPVTFQYKMDYKLGLQLESDKSLTTNWADINNAQINSPSSFQYIASVWVGAILALSIGVLTIRWILKFRKKRVKTNNNLMQQNSPGFYPVSSFQICANCGLRGPVDAKFCHNCGTLIIKDPNVTE